MRKILFIISVFTLMSAFVFAQTNQRYVGLQMLNLDPKPEAYDGVIEGSIDAGANLVLLTIFWDEVYKTATSTPDWRQPDRQIEIIKRKGAKVAIRINLSRYMSRLSGFWEDRERPQGYLFKPLEGIYGRTSFSLTSTSAIDKARGFVKEVCQRYNGLQQDGSLLFVSFVTTPIQELGHHFTTYEEGEWVKSYPKEYQTVFDYSPGAAAAFRRWAQQQYSSIQKLNYHWKTQETNWDNLTIPLQYGEANQLRLFQSKAGKDFYLFSHLTLKNFINNMISGIKEINPNFKVVNEYGSVIDAITGLRNTFAFKDLDENTDGTKINNDIRYDHKFMTDVIRSNRPNKWVMNEVFFDRVSSDADYVKQFDECFENGSKAVVFVIPDIEFLAKARTPLQIAANRWIPRPVTNVQPVASMRYSVSDMLDSTSKNLQKEWSKLAGINRQPVDIQLVEDILTNDYWKPVRNNILPTVKDVIYDKAVKIRKKFSLIIPLNTFADADGFISRIEVVSLPAWLKFENNELSGDAPAQLGEYQIRLRAVDNEQGTVEQSFKILVVDTNIKPQLVATLPDFPTYIEQYVAVNLKNYFNDPDGSIVRLQANGLQPWMSFDNGVFVAYPRSYGKFIVTVRAYDEDSTWAEGRFTFEVLNRPPQVINTLATKVIAQNKAFKYDLSRANIFADTDGSIVQIKALNRPSWLSFQDNVLSGTPTATGTFSIIIRAYDNGGDSTQTIFTIVVDTRANLNQPPAARFKIPNIKIFVAELFSYKIPDSLFFDTNGYIDRIETPNLPTWLTIKNNTISGRATKIGLYTVNIRAIDDDDASVTATFTIEVLYPKLNFELFEAGPPSSRKLITNLKNGDFLQAQILPQRINIRVNAETGVNKMVLKMVGPYQKSGEVKVFPYTLFDDEYGFAPIAGTYTYTATAYTDTLVMSQESITFKIVPPQPLPEWVVYPNPFENVCNFKLPLNFDVNKLTVTLIYSTGQRVSISKPSIFVADELVHILLDDLNLVPGTYFLELNEDQNIKKIVKVVKY
jgi:Beta-galactosidase/Putative Ig domain